jgi:hypothetical protein
MFNPTELAEWHKRIDVVFQKYKAQILALVDSDQTDKEKLESLGIIDIEELKNNENEEPALVLTKTTKHTLQHNKIVDMMDHYGLLQMKNIKYLEYGAGRGLLSHYLHERIDQKVAESEQKVFKLGH